MGLNSSSTADLAFEDTPAERLGEPGNGMRVALRTLDGGRIGIAAQAVGIAQAALELATGYAKERNAFGGPIARFQAIQHKLADMQTEIEAARALVWRAARLKEAGRPHSVEGAQAKLFASGVARRQTGEAIQILGGYGYTKEFPAERYYRDAKVTEIYEGTSEIQRLVIARALLGEAMRGLVSACIGARARYGRAMVRAAGVALSALPSLFAAPQLGARRPAGLPGCRRRGTPVERGAEPAGAEVHRGRDGQSAVQVVERPAARRRSRRARPTSTGRPAAITALDEFNYTVTDADGDVEPATVTVLVDTPPSCDDDHGHDRRPTSSWSSPSSTATTSTVTRSTIYVDAAGARDDRVPDDGSGRLHAERPATSAPDSFTYYAAEDDASGVDVATTRR